MNRAQRREAKKFAKKSGGSELEEKLAMVSSLDDKCRACHKDFDKNNIDMISEWMVVVRNDKNESHIYCPECWDFAQKMIEEETPEAMQNGPK